MEFFRNTFDWLGGFLGGIFDDIRRQVAYRTGSTGALGWILLIFKKWYLLVTIPAIVSLYWVLHGLEQAGILDRAENFISHHLEVVVDVSKYCTPHILNRQKFLECLDDPSSTGQGVP